MTSNLAVSGLFVVTARHCALNSRSLLFTLQASFILQRVSGDKSRQSNGNNLTLDRYAL